MQNDFVDGTLAIRDCPAEEEGADVVPVINQLIESCDFDIVVYSLDWHPKNHISFIENVSCRKLHHSSKVSSQFFIGLSHKSSCFYSTVCVHYHYLYSYHINEAYDLSANQ